MVSDHGCGVGWGASPRSVLRPSPRPACCAVGWRSEYGGTVYGRSNLVAGEGTFFFGQQTQVSQSQTCESDPSKLLTQEAPTSRFYGRGHVAPFSGMYDMQTQMFDQQVCRGCTASEVEQQRFRECPLARLVVGAHVALDRECDARGAAPSGSGHARRVGGRLLRRRRKRLVSELQCVLTRCAWQEYDGSYVPFSCS